ncbi:MAG TPA: ketosteroid isomerase-related protein [Rhizobiaceae bacterium]|nr:ketosteroid isomerase-related protein [Rhizobiaceae bacterium]
MSEASARQLIETYLEAFNAGDREAMLACIADDVAYDPSEGGREIGKDRFRWSLGMEARHFRETVSDVAIMVAEGGGRAAAEFTLRGTYLSTRAGLPAASGQSYSVLGGIFFEIDGGVFSRVTEYRDLAGWNAQLAKG